MLPKITRIYQVKRRYNTLRITIARRAYRCGSKIAYCPYYIHSIDSTGIVELVHESGNPNLLVRIDNIPVDTK